MVVFGSFPPSVPLIPHCSICRFLFLLPFARYLYVVIIPSSCKVQGGWILRSLHTSMCMRATTCKILERLFRPACPVFCVQHRLCPPQPFVFWLTTPLFLVSFKVLFYLNVVFSHISSLLSGASTLLFHYFACPVALLPSCPVWRCLAKRRMMRLR